MIITTIQSQHYHIEFPPPRGAWGVYTNTVACATSGHGQAASLLFIFMLSLPQQINIKHMDSITSWDGPTAALSPHKIRPGTHNPTQSGSGPCAAGARRVLNCSKLRYCSVMNEFKTPVSVLLNVPFHSTTKR